MEVEISDPVDHFLKEIGGHQEIKEADRDVIIDLLQGMSKDEIDQFSRNASRRTLASLRSSTRNLTTSCINQYELNEAGDHDAARQEIITQNSLEKTILRQLDSISDEQIQSSVSQSLQVVAEEHARSLGANETILQKIKRLIKASQFNFFSQ